MKKFMELPTEIRAMFWTMAVVVGLATFIGLCIVTEGVAFLVALGLAVVGCIYLIVLAIMEDW